MRWRFPVLVALAVFGLNVPASGQSGRTFVVNGSGDAPDSTIGDAVCAAASGVCTLRAALEEANVTAELDTIAFAIGSGAQRITILSDLPPVTSPVVIDGWTQPGFAGAPLIEIHGATLIPNGLLILGGNSILRGLVINGFFHGVLIAGGGGNALEGNYIGLDVSGTLAVRNQGSGVRIQSANNRVGGVEIAQRNVISGNGSYGIDGGVLVFGSAATGNVIQGNFIGLDASGINPVPNLGRGVAIHYASNNLVGGPMPGAGNLIAGNRATGVRVMAQSSGNVIQRNWIGINKLGQIRVGVWPEPGVLSNARAVHLRGDNNFVLENLLVGSSTDGVILFNGSGVDLFPDGYPRNNVIYGNVIAANRENGIGAYIGTGNRFIANRIFANGHLGINLAHLEYEGVTPNDVNDLDGGTNDFQNYPTLTSAVVSGGQTTVAGTLDSSPGQTYTIEFSATPACSPTGHGQGAYPVSQTTVSTDGAGAATFEAVLPVALPAGWAVTATATNPGGSTSEYSACVTVR